jgi:hypothetical protein
MVVYSDFDLMLVLKLKVKEDLKMLLMNFVDIDMIVLIHSFDVVMDMEKILNVLNDKQELDLHHLTPFYVVVVVFAIHPLIIIG